VPGFLQAPRHSATHATETDESDFHVRQLEAKHREAGQTLVAAPVLGRPDLAASGQLGIVAGGPEDAVARVMPLLTVMGKRIFPAGKKPESATAIKLANNAVLGCAMVAMAEGFALVRRYDVIPQVFQDVMVEGLFGATAYKVYGQKMVDQSFDQVGSPITVGLKDANLIAAAANIARVPMPSHNVYKDRLLGAVAHGDADRDQAVLARECDVAIENAAHLGAPTMAADRLGQHQADADLRIERPELRRDGASGGGGQRRDGRTAVAVESRRAASEVGKSDRSERRAAPAVPSAGEPAGRADDRGSRGAARHGAHRRAGASPIPICTGRLPALRQR